jgi:hypothetical protein
VVAVGFDAKGNQTLASVNATGFIQPVSINSFEVDVSERLQSVSATVSLGTVQAVINVNKLLNSVASTGSVANVITHVGASVSGVLATGSVEPLSFDIFEVDVSEKLLSVSATGVVTSVKPNLNVLLNSVAANTNIAGVLATGIALQFDVNAFDKDRVIYILAVPKENVVYIKPDNRTIMINEISNINQTIRVAA